MTTPTWSHNQPVSARSLPQTRENLSEALSDLVTQADEGLRQRLFAALNEYRGLGGRERALASQPIARLLVEAMEEGLSDLYIGAEMAEQGH